MKRLVQISLLLLLSTVVALFLLEALVRIFQLEGDYFYRSDPVMGWSLIPGKEGWHLNKAYGIKNYVKINSKGLRDKEYTYQKREATSRILILGDSNTEALQVQFNDTFCQVLEGLLNEKGVSRWEVINSGVGGYGTDNELLFYRQEGYKYSPDIVVLALTVGNDVLNNCHLLKEGADKPYFVMENEKLELRNFPVAEPNMLKRIRYFMAEHSRLFLLTANALFRNSPTILRLATKFGLIRDPTENRDGIPSAYFVYATKYSPEWENAWVVTKALISQINQEVKKHQSQFIVVILPGQEQYFDEAAWQEMLVTYPAMKDRKWDMDKPDRILMKFLEKQGMPYVHVLPVLRNRARKFGFSAHGHFSVVEHRIIGHLIYDFLFKYGMVTAWK